MSPRCLGRLGISSQYQMLILVLTRMKLRWHGVGKLKRDYLRLFYSEDHLRQMVMLKRAFDPEGILGRGNLFSEEYLTAF